MRRVVPLVIVLAFLLAPGVSACSFIAEPDGGTSVRVHDIRTGQFGFSGPTEFTFLMGNGDGWTSSVYDDGQHPAFSYDYGAAGTYVIEVHCHYLDDDTWEEATPTQVTVGGLLGIPLWMWGAIVAAVLLIVVLARAKAKASGAPEPERSLRPARARNLSTNKPRRAMGCFPRPDHHPVPFSDGKGTKYTATRPMGHSPDLPEVEASWEDSILHLDWFPPELPPDVSLTGYRLFEQRDGAQWVHRDNLPPEVNGLDIDHSEAAQGPYRITAYEVRPVFEMGAGRPYDAQGAVVTL